MTVLPSSDQSTNLPLGIISKLFQPISIYSLVVFRVLFGAVMLWEVYRYFTYDLIAQYWIDPTFHFTYGGFHWVQPWTGQGMYYHFFALAILASCIVLGLAYRISTVLFFLGFTYLFLLEQALYVNHLYLIVLISGLLVFLPAHRTFSVDAWLFPSLKRDSVPRWSVLVLQLQIGVVYFFGGIAKINPDWLRGEPMRTWLATKTDFPLVGQWFTEEWVVYFFSYSGLLIDLLAFPLLLYRKTQSWMFLALVSFHLMNDRLFQIGIFPWFAIGITTIFFSADWPLQVYRRFRSHPLVLTGSLVLGAWLAYYFHQQFETLPLLIGGMAGVVLATAFGKSMVYSATYLPTSARSRYQSAIAVGFTIWVVVQCAVPLRHFFIPGNVSWTEEGHRFAWHMKLRSKTGKMAVIGIDPEGGDYEKISPEPYLTKWQYRKVCTRPYLIQQYVSYLEQYYPQKKIRVLAECSLNGRKKQLLLNPNANLAEVKYRDWQHHDWILPLNKDDRTLGDRTR